ncbi:hypothetical protein GW17_00037749 [Ensete ventricosum]|nr:hypothetical protein GW17_00037749 [Ensete ventricosum]
MILQQVCNVCGTKNSRNFPLQFSKNIIPWKEISIRKWLKEMKQKRKEEERLQRAEVHAAISVAGVAAALAAIAAENLQANQHKSLRDTAVASAAALVAARCAHVAEAAGAKREQISSAIDAAATATDAANIFTLTAAAATSMKGAATLRGRQGQRQKTKGSSPALLCDDFGFDLGSSKAVAASSDPLGVLQILWESLHLPIKSGQLFFPLLLLSLLSSALLFFCYFSIAPIPLDLVSKISILLEETNQRPPDLLLDIERDLRDFAGLATSITLFFFFSSLFLVLATLYTFAMAYRNRNLTPKDLLLRIARRWYQTMITRLYVVLLTAGLGLLSSLGVGTAILVSDGSSAVFSFGLSLAGLLLLLYLYLLTRWSMSLVIAAVEEPWGVGALSWSVELYIGNKKRGIVLTLMLSAVKVAIYGAFAAVMMASGPPQPTEAPMAIVYIVAAADALWGLYSMAVYIVFYYECRKSHGME